MLRVERRVPQGTEGTPGDVLSLPYDERKKSRLRVRSEQGHEVAVVLERGSSLRHGDLLQAESGEVLLVRAAAESVSEVTSADGLLLTKAAYHLGNRHVPLQIEDGVLRYQHDHVLDGMVAALGLRVVPRMAAFEPEGGAYSGGAGHSHGHSHEGGSGHSHGSESGHGHGHGHGHKSGHSHSHGGGSGHSHSHDGGHSHSHGGGHSHSHDGGHSHEGESGLGLGLGLGTDHPRQSEREVGHSHDGGHSHSHGHGHGHGTEVH